MDTTYVPETERSYSRRAKYSFRSKSRPRAVFTRRRIKHCVIADILLRAFSLRISGQTGTSRQNSRPSPSRARIISSSFRLRIRMSGSCGKKDHGNAIIARFRERLSRLLRRFFKKACGICVIMPTPSPVVPSASLPVRCSSFSTILSASSTARCVFCPLILTTAPMPQASCCVCASKGRYWCGCIMLFFPLFRCKARPLPAPYSE